MRHVPEEELHPYLDQALSRSQCVEIETHLAECGHCRDQRDNIAALRDRTTALLGQLTPRNLIIPPVIKTGAAGRLMVRHLLRDFELACASEASRKKDVIGVTAEN